MIPTSYPTADEIARLTARMLLEIKAVHFNAAEPFTLASGLPSPTYIDCRKLISHPRIRATLMDFLTVTVMRNVGFEAFDNIAGGETAGIPFAAFVAERMALPMTYVRKKPKGYGRNARIEGDMTPGQRVLLVEDLTTDGGSKLSFVDAIRDTGVAALYITHDLATAYHVSDYVMVLYKGHVVEAGPPKQVIGEPQHPYTQLLIDSIPWPDLQRSWGQGGSEWDPETKEAEARKAQTVMRGTVDGFELVAG